MNRIDQTRFLSACPLYGRSSSRWFLLMIAGLLAGASGCAPMTIRAAHVPSARFPASGSYAWVPNTDPPGSTGIDVHQLDVDFISLDTRIRRAVDRELAAKGYRLAGSQTPDFLITYHVAAKERSTWGLT